mmetsp:Transcript_19050/g.42483  ORF Transcript_19050/g.42483 Transcript_19050/m.42483 type:complete len:268 (-) Transcript_19050:179-982(-)
MEPWRKFLRCVERASWSIEPYTIVLETWMCSSSACSSSEWWRVAVNTIVTCDSGIILRTRYRKAASFSFDRTLKKLKRSSSDNWLSVSRRTSWGSLSPALENCIRALGMVAEKSSVCLSTGHSRTISFSCSANPISNNRSASSNTSICTWFSLKVLISRRWCISRPGVAIMMSGREDRASNCASIPSPPKILTMLRSVNFAKSRANFHVWTASSLVGDKTMPRTPPPGLCVLSICTMGSRKAQVFPDPVRAIHTKSIPAIASGRDFL